MLLVALENVHKVRMGGIDVVIVGEERVVGNGLLQPCVVRILVAVRIKPSVAVVNEGSRQQELGVDLHRIMRCWQRGIALSHVRLHRGIVFVLGDVAVAILLELLVHFGFVVWYVPEKANEQVVAVVDVETDLCWIILQRLHRIQMRKESIHKHALWRVLHTPEKVRHGGGSAEWFHNILYPSPFEYILDMRHQMAEFRPLIAHVGKIKVLPGPFQRR